MRPSRHSGARPLGAFALLFVLSGCAAPPDGRMAANDCLLGALDDWQVASRLMQGEETDVPVFSRPGRPPFMAQTMCGPGTIRVASTTRSGRGRMASMEGRGPFFASPVSLTTRSMIIDPSVVEPPTLPTTMVELASY
ncbi:hypothetical protein ACQW02_09190 [Humitalea sp. 24SJ18S-53]|uniref:hypothetical protein n=1 Tax=Humitalea sp. 24SJ18S-53 TaxID=3422307 RepID=UPI003D6789BC